MALQEKARTVSKMKQYGMRMYQVSEWMGLVYLMN